MSAFAVSVEGVIDCQTAQQQEHHSFTYNTTHLTPAALSSIASASPSPSSISDASASPASSSPTPPPSAETAALHELVSLIHLAQKDGNAFLTSMLNKYPKPDLRGRRKGKLAAEVEEGEEDEDTAVSITAEAASAPSLEPDPKRLKEQ